MADVKKFWPVVVYAFVIWLNTDFLIPVGLSLMGPSFLLTIFVLILASGELCYSFWFWRWIVRRGPEIHDLRERRRQKVRKGLFKGAFHGLVDWVLDSILRGYRKVTNPENGTRRHIERWGVLAVWAAGLNPVPGLPTRGPCSIFLGFYGFRKEFVHLLVANSIHVTFVIWGWKQLLGH